MTRAELFDRIYDSYCTWYDMEHCDESESPLRAVGEFHSTDSSYVLSRKVTVWSAQSNDYLYIYDLDALDAADCERLIEAARTEGEKKINPTKDHRSSYVTAIFVCDTADGEAKALLKKYRSRKNFAFGLKGWEEVHAAAVTVSDLDVCSNGDGRNTAKFLRSIVRPKKKFFHKRKKGV